MLRYDYVVIGVVILVTVGVISTTLIIVSAPPNATSDQLGFRVGLVTAFLGAAVTGLLALLQGARNGANIAKAQEQLNGHTTAHVELNNGVVQLAQDAIKALSNKANLTAEEGIMNGDPSVEQENSGQPDHTEHR